MDQCVVITIGGELGSGKSTVSRMLAAELGLKRYSTGDIQRMLAVGMGLTSLELKKLAETDPSIDEKIDKGTVEIARRENRLVLDSRLAWYFVPDSFKVFLRVDPVIGAQRILGDERGPVEQYESLDEALALIRERRASEDRRFKQLYSADPSRLENYDLVVDTSHAIPEKILATIVEGYRAWAGK